MQRFTNCGIIRKKNAIVPNAKDISEKHLFDWPDVFADIWNFIAFDGKSVIQPIDLLGTKARTQLKVDGKLHEQERKTVSMVNYHLVFCPRYRRKIFLMDGLEARFKELVAQICEQNDIRILAMECHIDHCHLFVTVPPTMSPADVMKLIKGTTGSVLKREFFNTSPTTQIWTRSYFVSTAGDVSNATIERYIKEQKTKGG